MTTAAHVVAQTATSFPPVMLFPSVLVGCMFLAYFIGSIPFGLILGKMYKVGDLRQTGSGNIGATNMLRVGGRNLAVATLVLDMAKGFLAVTICGAIADSLLTPQLSADKGIKLDATQFFYFFGLYAVIGHVWPVWLNYKGGKGVATALGALLGFSPIVGLLALASWLAVFAVTRYSSFSALVSIGIAPLLCYAFVGKSAAVSALLIALIVFYRHRENILRLGRGLEPKVQLKKE
jgi:acyl phosphate:glycerol-3-phosphate acyltransferase